MTNLKIKEIHEEGKVSVKALITKCDRGRTNKNTPYLSLTLEDRTGVLDAKFWNLTDEMVAMYHVGMVVEAQGEIIFHKNAAQLRLRKLTEDKDADLFDYVREAPMTKAEMKAEVDSMLDAMKDPVIRDVTREVIQASEEKFYTYPAATRNHHNFVGGLAYRHDLHGAAGESGQGAVSLAGRGFAVRGHFAARPGKSRRAVLANAGGIHERRKPAWAHQHRGGHDRPRRFGAGSGTRRAGRFAEAHGAEPPWKMEYGSPVLPMIPEAEVLTLLDNLDSRMVMMKQSIDATQPGTFGPRMFALDNRMIYHRKEEER